MTNPYYINELQSDLRGVKEGWYALTNAVVFCPARSLIKRYAWQESASQGQANVESKVHLLTNRDSHWADVRIGQVWRGKRANEKFSWSYHRGCPQPVKDC